jgi:hypothetical protein
MEYFSSLTDMGLRRLYKFLLKRTLGKYLLTDITMDDIQVASRDGVIKLTNLQLNPIALNEEMEITCGIRNIPALIASASITEITVFLSYTTILTESCRFELCGVKATIHPNPGYDTSKNPVSSTTGEEKNSNNVKDQEKSDNKKALDEQSGLGFIANWIEIVVARLQVSIKDLDISICNPNEELSILLSLRDIQFFNSSYDLHNKHETALQMSKRISSQQSNIRGSLFTELSAKKVPFL